MFAAIISDVWNSQLIFLKLFPGIYTSKSLMNNSPPPFVQHYIGFLFIEEVVKMLLEYLGKLRSTVPPPWLLRACKTLHGVLLFRYVNRHTTRFSSEWKSYRHDPPGGGLGGAEPPQRVDPLPSWLGPAAAEQKISFDEAENRVASSLGEGANHYARISCVSKLLWV